MDESGQVVRILILHPEAVTRDAIESVLRRVCSIPVTVYQNGSLTEGFERVRRLAPRVMLLDLSQERRLAFDLLQATRAPDLLIVGMYNPLLLREGEGEFFRQAARAGVHDFVPLPVSEEELGAALSGALSPSGQGAAHREGRLVSFISCKGGVGNTTLAVNSAVLLAASGAVDGDVALCDAVVQLGNAAALLGLVPEHDMADMAGDLDDLGALSTYLTHHRETGLRVLASPRDPREAELIAPDDVSRVLISLRRRFALVLVDCPAVLDLLTLSVLDLSETIFVVTEAVTPTILATARFLELLEDQGFGADRVRVVLNRYSSQEGVLPQRMVDEELGRSVDHLLPHDKAALGAVSRGAPLVMSRPKAPLSEAIGELAESMLQPASPALRTRL